MRIGTWRWVAVLAAAACLGWLPFLGRSLSPDEGGFLIVGGQWSPGSSLYGDYWVDRPPVLIAIFGVADALGGTVPLRLIGTLAVVATVLLAGLLGRLAAPGQRRGVLACAGAAAIFAATPLFGGSVVNGQVLGLPFLVGGMAALVAAHASSRPSQAWAWGALAGVCGALGAMVKQNQVEVFVMALVLLLGRGRSARALAGLVAGAAVTTAVVLVVAAARGTELGALWEAMVGFRFDAAVVLTDPTQSAQDRFRRLLLVLLYSGAPLLVAVQAWTLRRRGERALGPPDLRWPACAVLAAELVVVLLGGSYWLHYLMGLVPGIVLLAAASAQRPVTARRPLLGVYAVVAMSTVVSIVGLGLDPINRPEEPVIAFLEDHAQPGDSAVVVFGGANIVREPELTCPYPYLWSLPARVRDPDLEELTGLLAGREPPTWLVVSYGGVYGWDLDFAEAQEKIDAEYTRIGALGRFTLYRLTADG